MEKTLSDTFSLMDDTSPSQLQEVTEENSSLSNSMGLLNAAPLSVKEYDEQLRTLRNENFNLKLRIYFLEEKMGINFTMNKDNILKQNVELQVQVSNLQKELQDKHELLCQAVKAMELEDEQHKKIVQSKEDLANQYKLEVDELKCQLLKTNEFETLSNKSDLFNRHSVTELQERIKTLEAELNVQIENNTAFRLVMDQTENFRLKCDLLKQENQMKDERIRSLINEVEKSVEKLSASKREIKLLEEKLEKSSNELEKMREKEVEKDRAIEEMLSQINELRRKYVNVKSDLEREHKKFERMKMMCDMKVGQLEEHNTKQTMKIHDLQMKLEAAVIEMKKNQNLAVANSSMNDRKTDVDSFSVSNTTTPNGTPKKDTLSIPLSKSSSSIQSPLNHQQISIEFDDVLTKLEIILIGTKCGEKILSDLIQFKNDLNVKNDKIIKLKAEQIKACEIIKSMIESRNKLNEELQQWKAKYNCLEKELETVATKQNKGAVGDGAEDDNKNSMGDSCTEDFELIDQYKTLVADLDTKIEVLVATLNEKDSQLQIIKAEHEELLADLVEKENRIVDLEFELVSHTKNDEKSDVKLQDEMEAKETEIVRLNSELKKCTCYLQEIVNKELWDKNREIEKLQRKCSSVECMKLKKELEEKSAQLNIIKEKISEFGIDIDLKRDEQSIDYEEQINKLKLKNATLEKLQNETNDVCTVLSNRLKELAIFLDSLLKQKCVLGFLGAQKNRQLREIIDNSLEFSRSFTMNMLVNPDESLVQLNNITSLLNDSVFQDLSANESNLLTYESHLSNKVNENETEQERVIKTLREQIVKLNSELQLRDNELNRLIGMENKLKPSDTDSVPLNYDDCAIGNKLNTTTTTLKYQSDQSESESWSEPDRNVSKQRIGLNNTTAAMILMKSTESTEDEVNTPSKRTSTRQTIVDLQKINADLEMDLKVAEEKRVVAENEIKLLQASVEELNRIKIELMENMDKKDKEMTDKLNGITVEKESLMKMCEKLKKDLENGEMTINSLNNDMKLVQEKLLAENEANLLQLQTEYTNNYVKKSEMEKFVKELGELKELVVSYESTIENCKLKENEINCQLMNTLETVTQLTSDLNQTVDEKIKLDTLNKTLEDELKDSKLRQAQLEEHLNDVQINFNNTIQAIEQQLVNVQKEKSLLEVKICELESTNAELHNKLIRIQTSPNRNGFQRQTSGNVSSEDDQRRRNVNQRIDLERNEANASPDLGIESDQGRFSSLETVQRPLLQTIDLTESMNNLLDGENNPLEGMVCDGKSCRQKLIGLINENGELKKKLARRTRALEETVNQLNIANQRKKQVEKTICKQIHKTSQVLRQARANLDSGSESDALRS